MAGLKKTGPAQKQRKARKGKKPQRAPLDTLPFGASPRRGGQGRGRESWGQDDLSW